MLNLIKKSFLSMIFAFILMFSIGCDNKNNGNNDNGGTPTASYEIDSAETLSILSDLQQKMDEFVVKMNDKDILRNSNVTTAMITSWESMLNDTYKATRLVNEFESETFEVDSLYANKTSTTDKFIKSENFNDEKLSIDIVCFTENESFENYIFEIEVNEGEIESLKLRNLLTTDTGTIVISMYEIVIDFVNETLDVFYAKPVKKTWLSTEEWLDVFLNEDNLINIEWGFLYTAKINLKVADVNAVIVEIYSDTISETLENAIIEFSYIDFYSNLTMLATSDSFKTIEDIFVSIEDLSYVEYNDAGNKFALAG